MGGRPGIGARNAACLDYPDQPCAYRWRGGEELREEYLVSLNAAAGP
jgi:hypothetical protein